MKHIDNKKLWSLGIILSAIILSAAAKAGCVENGYSSEVVTEYGGSTLSCPNNHIGCTIENIVSGETCSPGITNDDGTVTNIEISVSNKIISWEAYTFDDMGMRVLDTDHPIDTVITDTATGANGCFQAFGTDQVQGVAGFLRDNGSPLATKAISFCTDQNKEVTATAPPPPAVVEECVIASGQSKLIHGVTFSCPLVPDGETRTIVVSKDTTCTDVDMDGVLECSPVPDFGFTTDGNIDFNNVCQCIGSAEPGLPPSPTTQALEEECDPDPANPAGCQIGDNARVPVEVLYQNPKCFTIGGKRKCF